MTVTLELSAEMEDTLQTIAAARGLAVSEVIRGMLETQVARAHISMTPKERASAWRAAAENLPSSPPLSDEAISRASIYETRE